MAASGDRFYLLEFRDRPVLYGDIGSNLRISGLVVTGGGAAAVLMLPGHLGALKEACPIGEDSCVRELTLEEWSDFIRRSDDPEILVGLPKIFQRKVRYDISGAVQQKVWAVDGFKCMYCGAKMGNALLTIDHFMPLELGGENAITNYLTACRACNKLNGNSHPTEWPGPRRYETLKRYIESREIV